LRGRPSTVLRMVATSSPLQKVLRSVTAALMLLSIAVLLVCDAVPGLFPAKVHLAVAPLSLGLTAVAILLFYVTRRASFAEWVKALIVALAFFFWAANQLCTDVTIATALNDVAIALFVLDVVLVILGWPAGSEAALGPLPGSPATLLGDRPEAPRPPV
jgi:hypothetical protein